jgi:hypothetical protein
MPAISSRHSLSSFTCSLHRRFMIPLLLSRPCCRVAEPLHRGRNSSQDERQVENTDGAAQSGDSGNGRCARKPLSVFLHSTLLRDHVQGAGYRGGHQPAVRPRTRPCGTIYRRGQHPAKLCEAQTAPKRPNAVRSLHKIAPAKWSRGAVLWFLYLSYLRRP